MFGLFRTLFLLFVFLIRISFLWPVGCRPSFVIYDKIRARAMLSAYKSGFGSHPQRRQRLP